MKIRYTILAVMALMAAPKGFTALDDSQKQELNRLLAIQPDQEVLIAHLMDIDRESFLDDFLDMDKEALYRAVRIHYDLPDEVQQSDVQGGSVLGKRPAAPMKWQQNEEGAQSSQKRQKVDVGDNGVALSEKLKTALKSHLGNFESIIGVLDPQDFKSQMIEMLKDTLSLGNYGNMVDLNDSNTNGDILKRVKEYYSIDDQNQQSSSRRRGAEEAKEEEDQHGNIFPQGEQQQQPQAVKEEQWTKGVYLEDVVDLLKEASKRPEDIKKYFLDNVEGLFKAKKNGTEQNADPGKTLLPEIALNDLKNKITQAKSIGGFLDLFLSELDLDKDIVLSGLTTKVLDDLIFWTQRDPTLSRDDIYNQLLVQSFLAPQDDESRKLKDIAMGVVKTVVLGHHAPIGEALARLKREYQPGYQPGVQNNNQFNSADGQGLVSEAYRTLGLDEHANWEAVRKAYKILVRQTHPDKNPDKRGDKDMIDKIIKAYKILDKHLK